MKMVFSKLFRHVENNKNKVNLVAYDPSQIDYYTFLEKQSESNKQQIILNSSFMILLLEYFFKEKKYDINNIEFAEDEGIYSNSLKPLISAANENRINFEKLLSKLKILKSEDSIEIYKITLEDADNDNDLSFKSNGIITMNLDCYEDTKKIIESFLESILNV